VEAVGDGGGELLLDGFAEDRAHERGEEPSEPAEFGFAEGVVQVVDMDADGFQCEKFLEALTAELDVQGDVDALFVELKGRNTLICEAQNPRVRA